MQKKIICHRGFMKKCFQVLKKISAVRTGLCTDMNASLLARQQETVTTFTVKPGQAFPSLTN